MVGGIGMGCEGGGVLGWAMGVGCEDVGVVWWWDGDGV